MKRITPSWLWFLLLILAVNVDLWGAEKVKLGLAIGTTPTYYLPVEAAREKDFFKQNNVDIEVVPFVSGAAFGQALAAGAIDMGVTASSSSIYLVVQGLPVVIVSELVSKAPFIIYVRTSSRIKELKDLAGAKIGVPQLRSVSEFLARSVVKRLGIEKEVRFVGAGGLPQTLAGFKVGALDAIVQPLPSTVKLVVAGEIREVANTADFLPKEWIEHVVNVRKDFITKNPGAPRAVGRALVQSGEFMRWDPSWAIERMKSTSGFSDQGARAVYEYIKFTSDGKISKVALQNVIDFMAEWRLIPKEKLPAFEQLYLEDFSR